ncbi:hypothetical protein Q427_05855 [Halomonas sp. BC04]|nr:hypothetical protein Q427_05855 [Halomonas sp. BC04]
MFTLRRMNRFPGAQVGAYVLPTVTIVFLLVVAVLFFLRESYTRQVLFTGYLTCLVWFILGNFLGRRYRRLKLAVVPVGKAREMKGTQQIELRQLERPDLERVRYDGVVADLHSDELTPEWERFLARCTLAHIPVYHTRQIRESITGRVEITHLSENEYGALLPNGLYQGLKRLVDLAGALILLPLLAPLLLVTALLIKRDSPGPALFVQTRMGYRGRPFKVYKFRSMYCDLEGRGFTEGDDDPRITRVGRVIRKYRIDELPQILNVIKGEMSFIGRGPSRSASRSGMSRTCRSSATATWFGPVSLAGPRWSRAMPPRWTA